MRLEAAIAPARFRVQISIFSWGNSLPKLGSSATDHSVIPKLPRSAAPNSPSYFLTKPRQLIKFDLIVRISKEFPRCSRMKNVYEVLRQKELELSRLEKEVEALRVAAPLLSEDKEGGNENKPTLAGSTASQQPIRI